LVNLCFTAASKSKDTKPGLTRLKKYA